MQDLRRLLRYLKPHWGKFALAILAMIAAALLQNALGALIVPIFNQVLPSAAGGARRVPTLYGLQRLIPTDSRFGAWRTIAYMLLIFTVLKGAAEYFSTYLMARIGQESVLKLREDLYAQLLKQSAEFYERHRTNYLVSRLVTSAAAIETAVTHTLRDMLRESFMLVAFLAAAFYYSWRLTLGSLIIAPLIGFLTAKFGKRLKNLAHESFVGSQKLVDTAQETLAHQSIVKAYRAEARESRRFHRVAVDVMRANLRSAKISGISPPTIELIGVIAIAALIMFAQYEIRDGRMDAPQFLAFLFFLFSSYDPMRKLSRLQHNMEQALAAARHVWEVMDEKAEMPEKPNAVALAPLREAIELRSVSFGYASGEHPVLRDVNLKINAGAMVALVGQSGGGKSTLTKLLLRFHDPDAGAVLWDETDLRDASIASLRRQIALVTQEVALFNDTVRYNIAYARPDATNAEIERAARVAFAHDFIMQLPHGYDTLVGERGASLSGGQRQRIAIARAVLAEASVLILDEATSALDAESEQIVQEALMNLLRNRTSVVIAHRLSTIRRADLIVVMEGGRIVETGTHAELLQRDGAYRKLYDLQFATEEESGQWSVFSGQLH
jgi:subfamily B ATP-binding cassette protein MsbA